MGKYALLVINIISFAIVVFGHASATTVFCGVPVAQAFATGALAYNFVALCIAPFWGIEIEPIELDTATQPSLPNPYDRMERT